MKNLLTVFLALISMLAVSSVTHGQRLGLQPPPPQSSRYDTVYDQGFRQGEWDARNNRSPSISTGGWMTLQERRDYEAGYRSGYEKTLASGRAPAQDRTIYRQGVRDGRRDAELGRSSNAQTDRWKFAVDRRDYESGYRRGYQLGSGENVYGLSTPSARPSLVIYDNRTVSWNAGGLQAARVVVKMDNRPEQLFAEAPSGSQDASWIEAGHLYVFSLRDMNGRELAQQRVDLRSPSFWRGLFGN